MTARSGGRAVVLRYAGKKEYGGVLYRILRLYIENRESERAMKTAGKGGGGGCESDA